MYSGEQQTTRAEPADPVTPLAGEIINLETHLNDLGMAAEVLHHRLGKSVLRPEAKVENIAKDKEDPRPVQCQLGERVAFLTRRVRNITNQLQNALDRLEA